MATDMFIEFAKAVDDVSPADDVVREVVKFLVDKGLELPSKLRR